MSNPTSAFGWQMPQNTDLVTDLPADFEVFGQAVDTSMADLLGGTTGQILAKNSATNMDFVWIANDQGDITGVTAGTGITVTSPTGPVPTVSIDTATTVDKTTAQTLTNKTLTSPVLTTPSISNINAKGDILVGTADDTLGIITAGSNGESLVADSTAPTGLKYQAPTVNTVVDAKGDLLAGTAADTIARLAVGTNYKVLSAQSAQATGLQWAGAITSYTPDWQADVGLPAIGNGQIAGYWQRYGNLCHVRFFFQLGSTSTTGTSGGWYFSLPFTASTGTTTGNSGNFYGEDFAVAGYRGQCGINSVGTYFSVVAGTNVAPANFGKTSPFTWATNDYIAGQFIYEVA